MPDFVCAFQDTSLKFFGESWKRSFQRKGGNGERQFANERKLCGSFCWNLKAISVLVYVETSLRLKVLKLCGAGFLRFFNSCGVNSRNWIDFVNFDVARNST